MAVVVLLAISACGGGAGGTNNSGGGSTTGPNVLPVTVDAGPPDSGYNVNRLYASVTVCQPGSTSQCQVIDHVLVDTGSTGLRLLASVISPAINLPRSTGTAGFPLVNCVQFVDNTYAFGSVAIADVTLGGKRAASLPVQVVGEASLAPLSGVCSTGTSYTTVSLLGAKGILGIGNFKQDCGARCVNTAANGYYFTCTSAACNAVTRTTAGLDKQVANPVAAFASDNNGFVLDLPAAPAAVLGLNGFMIFGVGTQGNNQVGNSTLLTTNSQGFFTTRLNGRAWSGSFIDTGSNGIYFDSTAFPACTGNAIGFYCPVALSNFVATATGTNGATVSVPFAVENPIPYFAGGTNNVVTNLAGSINNASTFDWGLPFFYGRRVVIGIEGQSSPLGVGPYLAF
jgi:hypothetical protein